MTSLFFATIFLFLCLPFLLGKLFKIEKIFPPVFLQIILGFAFNASGMLDWLKAHNVDFLKGPLAAAVDGIGWFGLLILIALVGGASTPASNEQKTWRFVPISLSGFFFTFLVGSLIGLQLIRHFSGVVGSNASVWHSALTLGVTLAVTALPVLIAILRETGLTGTRVGSLAVNAAMLDDVWLWLSIALLLSVGKSTAHFLLMFAYLAAYAVFMLCILKPALRRWYAPRAKSADPGVVLIFVSIVCFSAMLTDVIGLHPLLGAFVAGVIFPKQAIANWRESLMNFSQLLLLPFYFILTGMRLNIDVSDSSLWLLAAIVTAVAVLSKFSSVFVSARCTGMSWRDSALLGSLMQCKGLMELVAINIFLGAGLIGPKIHAALALMALISTLITAPAIAYLRRRPQVLETATAGVPAL